MIFQFFDFGGFCVCHLVVFFVSGTLRAPILDPRGSELVPLAPICGSPQLPFGLVLLLLAPFGSLLVPFGSLLVPVGPSWFPFGSGWFPSDRPPLAPFWFPSVRFGLPLVPFGLPLAPFWFPLAPWFPFGSPWLSVGSLLAHLWLCVAPLGSLLPTFSSSAAP